MPKPKLPLMTFPAPAVVPPIVTKYAEATAIPAFALGPRLVRFVYGSAFSDAESLATGPLGAAGALPPGMAPWLSAA